MYALIRAIVLPCCSIWQFIRIVVPIDSELVVDLGQRTGCVPKGMALRYDIFSVRVTPARNLYTSESAFIKG